MISWWSRLRLRESLNLYWDRDDRITVDFDGRYPMFRIRRQFEKGNKDRPLPMAPEFARHLEGVEPSERKGRVFKFMEKRGQLIDPTAAWVGKIVSLIGKIAGVKVNTDVETGRIKYASLHDLRRSFGER